MSVQGTPKFNAVVLMEISSINFTNGQPQLAAKAAFVKLETGHTYGFTTGRIFSQETQAILKELRASMERDIANTVFEVDDGPAEPSTGFMSREPGGLSEGLRSDASDAEPV